MNNDEIAANISRVQNSADDGRDRIVRVETTLFKLCMHMGMNPKTGRSIRQDPITFNEGGHKPDSNDT